MKQNGNVFLFVSVWDVLTLWLCWIAPASARTFMRYFSIICSYSLCLHSHNCTHNIYNTFLFYNHRDFKSPFSVNKFSPLSFIHFMTRYNMLYVSVFLALSFHFIHTHFNLKIIPGVCHYFYLILFFLHKTIKITELFLFNK